MVNHVFRISTYGGLYHEGEFVKETESPQGVLDAYNAAWKRYEARVDEARQALRTLEQKRKDEALDAAKAEGRP